MRASSRLTDLRPRRVAVFRALQLGDLLCAIPALRALRAALPEAEVTLIGLPWAADFVRRFPGYLDRFIAFPGHPGMPEQAPALDQFPSFLADVQSAHFDAAIQMHGSGSITNPLVQLFGATTVAGCYPAGGYCPDEDWFLPFPESEMEVRVLLRLMAFLGVPSQGEHLEFPLQPEDRAELAMISRQSGLTTGAYVCVHPGARMRSRRWPVERFAAVADALAEQGLSVVLTGSSAEAELTAAVARTMRAPSVNLAGGTSLGGLAALVEGARLIVCNDTGISHIAAAAGTPSVVVASGSDPARWAPLDTARHRVLAFDTPCRPCAYEVCPIDHPCATGITARAVVDTAVGLLRGTPAPAASPITQVSISERIAVT